MRYKKNKLYSKIEHWSRRDGRAERAEHTGHARAHTIRTMFISRARASVWILYLELARILLF